MQDRYLPRDLCGTRPSSQERRGDHILRFCGVARRVRRSQGEVRRQSLEAIEVLEEGYCEDGGSLGVRHGDAERRPLHFHGYTQGIPTISPPSVHAGLVRVPLRLQVLSMCCTALRLGAVTPVVYKADGHLRGRAKKIGLSHTVISRRLFTSPFFARGGKYKGSLCCRSRSRRQVDEESRSHKTSEQGRLDWDNSDRAPCSEDRQCGKEVHHSRTQGSEGHAVVKGFATRRPSWSEKGPGEEVDSLLWCLCVAHVGYAMGLILHTLSILGHGSGEESRRTGTCSSLTPKYPRPPQVAGSLTTRTLRSPGGSPSTPSCYLLRRRRHGLWGHPPFRQPRTGNRRAVACPRYMGLAGPRPFHFVPGVVSNPQVTHGIPWSQVGTGVASESTAACRKPSRRSHYQRTGLGKSSYDAGTSEAQALSRSSGSADSERMVWRSEFRPGRLLAVPALFCGSPACTVKGLSKPVG